MKIIEVGIDERIQKLLASVPDALLLAEAQRRGFDTLRARVVDGKLLKTYPTPEKSWLKQVAVGMGIGSEFIHQHKLMRVVSVGEPYRTPGEKGRMIDVEAEEVPEKAETEREGGLKREKQEKPKICSICGAAYQGYGNNAQPVNAGRCCDACDQLVVIPRRMEEL